VLGVPRRFVAREVRRAYLWIAMADEKSTTLSDLFRRFANAASAKLGTHWAFIAALLLVIGWAVTGPMFDYSETWQLVINTGTTIITFLMVFLIQSTQNRDAKAIHLKLDELIRASKARNVFADLEDATDSELEAFENEFRQLRKRGVRHNDAMIEAHQNTLADDSDSDSDSDSDPR
jgi:low affinity Fe/Cu permease